MTQIDRLLNALQKTAWLTLPELHQQTGDPVASISANIRNLRKAEHGAYVIVRRRRVGSLHEYGLRAGGVIENKTSR